MSEPVTKPSPFAPGWDQARWEQLFKLDTLLREVASINHGSRVLERLQRCIELAEELQRWDIDAPTPHNSSLTHFLKERALIREEGK